MLEKLILQLLLLLPIALVGVLALCHRVNLRDYRRIAISASTLPIVILLYMLVIAVQRGSLADFYIYFPTRVSIISFSYGVDHVSLWLCAITSIIMLTVLMSAIHIKKRHKLFYVLALLVEATLIHIYLSRDGLLLCAALLVLAFLFMLLIGIWGDENAVRSARRFFYWQLSGIFFITMSCILLLSVSEHTLGTAFLQLGELLSNELQYNLTEVPHQEQRLVAFIMLMIGLACFIPVIGLHRPFMAVYKHSHLVVSMMHSVGIGAIGVYISYRIGIVYFADWYLWISKPVIWLMGIQWLLACIGLWRQKSVKGWLAYIIWGQYSIMIILLLSVSELGLTMMWLYMLSFQLITALLSVLIISLVERTHSVQLEHWSGQIKGSPFVSGMFMVALLALMGLPGLSHFLGTYHALLLSFPVSRWITVAGLLGLASMVAYNARLLFRMQHGQTSLRNNEIADLRFIEAMPTIVLLTFIIVLGSYPVIVVDLLELEMYQLHRYWMHNSATIDVVYNQLLSIFAFNSSAWRLPVMLSVVMSLVIWLVNNRQKSVKRMLLWQAVYHTLTLVVVFSSADAMVAELDMKRTVLIAIWYVVMILGSISMFRTVLSYDDLNIRGLAGLYHRKPLFAFLLMLFMFALMSAPLSAGFSYQLSMIELWNNNSQYGLIMLWLVAHALMATIPLEYIITMYMVKESEHELHNKKHEQISVPRYWYIIGYSCLVVLVGLSLWM